jgi:hypothetical protein
MHRRGIVTSSNIITSNTIDTSGCDTNSMPNTISSQRHRYQHQRHESSGKGPWGIAKSNGSTSPPSPLPSRGIPRICAAQVVQLLVRRPRCRSASAAAIAACARRLRYRCRGALAAACSKATMLQRTGDSPFNTYDAAVRQPLLPQPVFGNYDTAACWLLPTLD